MPECEDLFNIAEEVAAFFIIDNFGANLRSPFIERNIRKCDPRGKAGIDDAAICPKIVLDCMVQGHGSSLGLGKRILNWSGAAAAVGVPLAILAFNVSALDLQA